MADGARIESFLKYLLRVSSKRHSASIADSTTASTGNFQAAENF